MKGGHGSETEGFFIHLERYSIPLFRHLPPEEVFVSEKEMHMHAV